MPKYSSDLGCYSLIGIISLAIGTLYLLFTNTKELFNGTLNILTVLLMFLMVIGLSIYLPGLFSSKKRKEKIHDTIAIEVQQKENEVEKIENEIKPKSLNDTDFLDNLVFNLNENSTFEMNFSSSGELELHALLFYDDHYSHEEYKKEGSFKSFGDVMLFLRKNTRSD